MAALSALLFLVLFPLLISINPYYLHIATFSFLYAILCISWSIMALSGYVSLGLASTFGLGCYLTSILSVFLHIPPIPSIVISCIISSLSGALVNYFFSKLGKKNFPLLSFAFTGALQGIFLLAWFIGGPEGIRNIPPLLDLKGNEHIAEYYFVLIAFLIAYISYMAVWKYSRKVILALKDDEMMVRALGVRTERLKLGVFLFSCLLSSLGGAIYAHLIGIMDPLIAFNIESSIKPLIMSMAGGIMHMGGPVGGAIMLYLCEELLIHPWVPGGYLILYGGLLVVCITLAPDGIIQTIVNLFKKGLNHATA